MGSLTTLLCPCRTKYTFCLCTCSHTARQLVFLESPPAAEATLSSKVQTKWETQHFSQISRYSQRALLLVTSRLQLPASAHFSIPTQPLTFCMHCPFSHHITPPWKLLEFLHCPGPIHKEKPHCVISGPLRFSHQEKVRNASEFLREKLFNDKERARAGAGRGSLRQGSAVTPSKKERKGKKLIGRKSLKPHAALRRS